MVRNGNDIYPQNRPEIMTLNQFRSHTSNNNPNKIEFLRAGKTHEGWWPFWTKNGCVSKSHKLTENYDLQSFCHTNDKRLTISDKRGYKLSRIVLHDDR